MFRLESTEVRICIEPLGNLRPPVGVLVSTGHSSDYRFKQIFCASRLCCTTRRGAAEGCCRHLTFKIASSEGVWLAMAALASSSNFLYVTAATAPAPVLACAPWGERVRQSLSNAGPALPCAVTEVKERGESESECPPGEGRGAAAGCCRHLTFEMASSDGVWLVMAR